MKATTHIITVLVIVLSFFNCKQNATPEIKVVEVTTITETSRTLDPNAAYAKAEFTISGMVCEIGCAKTIEKKLANMEGVKFATVDFDKKLAMVEYDETRVTPTTLEETVTKVGKAYKVSDMKTVDAFSE